MNKSEFVAIYTKLGDKCKRVLQLKLAKQTNKQIAESLSIPSEATVRKHLEKAYGKFGLKGEERRGSWSELQMLFVQFMPELIPSLPVELQPIPQRRIERQADILQLQKLASENHKIILILGERGIGKTTLAQQYLASGDFEKYLELKIALEPDNIPSAEGVVQQWLKQQFQEDAPKEFCLSLNLLEGKLRQLKVAIFIDNLDPALHKGRFLEKHRNYVELLRVLSDRRIKGLTLITSREKLEEPNLRGIQAHVLS